jgi:hypothetical protein
MSSAARTAPIVDLSDDASWWETFPTSRRGLITFALVTALVGLWYSWYTDQVWEDALITLRHGENLLQGEGLVYNPGERVHGFTSPINVLLLTLCKLVTPGPSYAATFWLYRVFTIVAFAGGGVFLLRALANLVPRWTPALWFAGLVYMFDLKSVAFSANGMETGFMLALVGWAMYLLTLRSPDVWMARGLCWAGLMWTRPDGCVFIAVLSLVELLFLCQGRRWPFLQSFAKSAGLMAMLYSPWILWAWWYYGSPIPHTVIAKANVEFGPVDQVLRMFDELFPSTFKKAATAFRPIHFPEDPGNPWLPSLGWTRVISGLTKVVGVVALLYWMFPVPDRFGRAFSFGFLLLCLYLSYLPIAYPWYFPPVMMLGLAALVRGVTTFVSSSTRWAATGIDPVWWRRLVITILVLLVLGQIGVFGIAAQEEQIRQEVVENECRAMVGAYIKEHGKPGDTVYLEPLGYVGYYSGMRMMDFPGLVSPKVVRIRREEAEKAEDKDLAIGYGRVLIIPRLDADWIVLRGDEVRALRSTEAAEAFEKNYIAVKGISVMDKLKEYRFLPGASSLRFDAAFGIFRRKAAPALPPSDGPAAKDQ